MRSQSIARVEKSPLRFDDDVQFIRSWIEKPLATGAVMPSATALARTMARYVDPQSTGPGDRARPGHRPGHGGAGRARRRSGAAGAGRVQSEFLPHAAHALSGGDRGAGRRLPAAHLLETLVREPAAAIVSGLPLVTKPLRTRLRLIGDAMTLLAPGRAVRAVHLCDGAADPEGAQRHPRRGLAADLAEPAAGAGVDLSRPLDCHCSMACGTSIASCAGN